MECVCFKYSHKKEGKFSTGSWVRASTSVLCRGGGEETRDWQRGTAEVGRGAPLVGLGSRGEVSEVAVVTRRLSSWQTRVFM